MSLYASQGNENHPEQLSSIDDWSSEDTRSDLPVAQLREAPALHITHRSWGTGLLSKWKASQAKQSYSNGHTAQASLAEQDTLEQPSIQESLVPLNIESVQPLSQAQGPALAFYPQAASFSGPAPGAPVLAPPRENWQVMQPLAGLSPFTQPPAGNGHYPQKRAHKKKRRFPIWARVAVAMLLVLLAITGSGLYYYYANFATPLSHITGQTVVRLKGDSAPNQRGDNTSGSILSGGRINILLLGSDDDYKSVHIYGGILSQTDIVVSIDPTTKSVAMLSIPRDSWVDVPGFGMHKLDQAFLLGGGGAQGAALVMATIHQNFGIYIDHYAWVGLTGFVNVINTVGGIDIDVLHPITDDSYPDDMGKGASDPFAYKRLYIAPGPQHLTGLTALEYVRSRHADLIGDFGRSARQQQILDQLKYKLDNPDILGELPAIAKDLDGYVKTDMQLQDVFDLVYFAKSLNESGIGRYTLGPPYSTTANLNTSAGVQSVVILDCSKVQPLIAKVFNLGDQATCQQVDPNNPDAVPGTSQPVSSMPQASTPASNPLQVVNQVAQISTLSIGSGNYNVLGIHSLLDLLFLVVFESPAALEV